LIAGAPIGAPESDTAFFLHFAALRAVSCSELVDADGVGHHWRVSVGDKSPKSKQRDQKQKDAAKVKGKAKKDTAAAATGVASQFPKKK
jgi:hypothetical protein